MGRKLSYKPHELWTYKIKNLATCILKHGSCTSSVDRTIKFPVCAPGDTIKETYAKFFEVMVNSLVSNLVFSLVLEAVPGVGVGFEVLAQNNKFMKQLEKIKGQFDERYQLLTEGKRKRL